MKAMVFERFGSSKELHPADVPTPEPKENEVQIRLVCAAVNPVDWKIREGFFGNAMPHDFPIIPGWDGAGVVTKVGNTVRSLKVGDEVYGYFRKPVVKWGTYAEYVCMPEEFIALKPKKISMQEAASLPLASLTAWQALFDFANLQPKQKLLVHAGAGGVGGMAVQFGAWKGATVIATASQKNHDYVRALGANLVVDYHQNDWLQKIEQAAPEGYDVILDCVGGELIHQSIPLLKQGGTLVSIVERDLEKYAKPGIRLGFVFVAPQKEELAQLARLIDENKIKPPQIQVFPLEQAQKAQDVIREGHVCGKLVLQIST